MQDDPKRRIRKLRDENARKLRQSMVQFGESLLRSRKVSLPTTKIDRERTALIEAYRDLIQSKTRELKEWKEHRERATNLGKLKEAQFRQQMITGMESQLERYRDELRRLRSSPGSFWMDAT
jgi:hypothetical protein